MSAYDSEQEDTTPTSAVLIAPNRSGSVETIVSSSSNIPLVDVQAQSQGTSYGFKTGLVYVFNLIVGTGALTLPAAFGHAGGFLSFVIILILAFMSFLTVTFMIELMSISNALIVRKQQLLSQADENVAEDSLNSPARGRAHRERDPLLLHEDSDLSQQSSSISSSSVFDIKEQVEMGGMAKFYFGTCGVYLFYLCITIYLYGDLAIYTVVVSKSLRDVFCTYSNITFHNSSIIPDTEWCWSPESGLDRFDAYRFFSIIFLSTLGPFVFFNVSKTKYLQIGTTLMRWLAFIIMIALAMVRIVLGKGTGHPKAVDFYGVPNLFGVCVYSYMCHHSLPSLVTPIPNKRRLLKMFIVDYGLVTIFYLLLALTGIFAFNNLKDVYTLNFEPEKSAPSVGFLAEMIQYFLALFPVFSLSTSFPIIAITLRNNLKTLFQVSDHNLGMRSLWYKLYSRVFFPLLAILPPFVIAFFECDVQLLTSITGSYAGAAIQYVIPVLLLFYARKSIPNPLLNPYKSPFSHSAWLWFVMLWAIVCVLLVTINLIWG